MALAVAGPLLAQVFTKNEDIGDLVKSFDFSKV